ncbi:MAG TPA: hypothetical protein VMN58_05455 [Acidimicrobiales bacterium]|nr:hypothetical protein [Acidimicrobiales bacterium]
MHAPRPALGRCAAGLAVLALIASVAFALGTGPVQAQAGGEVTADKEGWWNRLAGAEDEAGAPANPLGGSPAPAPDSGVPEGAVAVGATLGETDKVAAIGIVLPVERGAVVSELRMDLALAEGTGAQRNEDGAGVLACPITGFFVPEENGEFANRPEADCDISNAPGERLEDGSWTFDLTAIASLWVDSSGTLIPNGVLLVPDVEPPESFQLSFAGLPDGVTFAFSATAGGDPDDPFGADGGGFDDAPSRGGGGFDPGSPPAGTGGGSFTPPPPPAAGPGPEVDGDDEAIDAPAAGGSDQAAPTTQRESQAGNTLGNIPPVAWITLVAGLALAVVAAWSLGSANQVEPTARRTGGVSRALAARATAAQAAPRTATEMP